MQINYIGTLTIALLLTLHVNGMNKTEHTKEQKRKQHQKKLARDFKRQGLNEFDSEYGDYEAEMQNKLKQREAKRSPKNLTPN